MKCPICEKKMRLFWLGGPLAIWQCPENKNHLLFPSEPWLEKSTFDTVSEREKRVDEAKLLIIFIEENDAKKIASIGARVEIRIEDRVTSEDEIKELYNKYAETLLTIGRENRERIRGLYKKGGDYKRIF